MTDQDIADGADTMILLNAEIEKRVLQVLVMCLSPVAPADEDPEIVALRLRVMAGMKTAVRHATAAVVEEDYRRQLTAQEQAYRQLAGQSAYQRPNPYINNTAGKGK
jgi:methylglyoxal synthase